MNTHDRAHPSCIGIGTCGEEHNPEHRPKAGIEGEEIADQWTNGYKIAGKGKAGSECNRNPSGMFKTFACDKVTSELSTILLAAFVRAAF